jgi:hypothetical protein
MGFRERLGSIVTIVIAAVAALQQFGILPFPIPLLEVGKEMSNILALAALIAFGGASIWVGYEIKSWWNEKRMIEIGGKHFDSPLYLTKDLGVLDHLLIKPVKSLRVMGISASEFTTKHRDTTSELLRQGIRVQILLLDPREIDSKPGLVGKYIQVAGAPNTRDMIVVSLGQLKTLATSNAKLEVRQHTLLPFHSMIIVDDSFIQVGFYLYKAGPPNRPQAIVSKMLHPKIFELLEKSYTEAWDMAKPV